MGDGVRADERCGRGLGLMRWGGGDDANCSSATSCNAGLARGVARALDGRLGPASASELKLNRSSSGLSSVSGSGVMGTGGELNAAVLATEILRA